MFLSALLLSFAARPALADVVPPPPLADEAACAGRDEGEVCHTETNFGTATDGTCESGICSAGTRVHNCLKCVPPSEFGLEACGCAASGAGLPGAWAALAAIGMVMHAAGARAGRLTRSLV